MKNVFFDPKKRFFVLAVFLFSCPKLSVASAETSEHDLASILARAAAYCDKLSQSVMNFTCREQIKERYRSTDNSKKTTGSDAIFIPSLVTNEYVYDYQLIRGRGGSIRENRILLNDNGREVKIADAPLPTHVFFYADVVMGPLGLLSRANQANNDFRIKGEEKAGGETAVVIEVVPKPGARLDHLFGTVWVRKVDARILKIEWNPSSMDNYAGVEDVAARLGMKPVITMTSEYAFEKNGILFPSHYTIKENYTGSFGRRVHMSQLDVTYDRYKFFSVETEVIYK